MNIVLITALGVGCATISGSLAGFIFKDISHKFSDVILSFASGVMLAASIIGLILPAIDGGSPVALILSLLGIFTGALTISAIDRIVPHFHRIIVKDAKGKCVDKVLLFVIAIAIHNIPEGLAAGVGFGTENPAEALLIAGGIALQNFPEGMVLISPMLSAGISARKTFLIAFFTGVVEIVFTVIGYVTVSISNGILPFILSFAGGTMIFVISDEMIPETHADGNEKGATFAMMVGFCLILFINYILTYISV